MIDVLQNLAILSLTVTCAANTWAAYKLRQRPPTTTILSFRDHTDAKAVEEAFRTVAKAKATQRAR